MRQRIEQLQTIMDRSREIIGRLDLLSRHVQEVRSLELQLKGAESVLQQLIRNLGARDLQRKLELTPECPEGRGERSVAQGLISIEGDWDATFRRTGAMVSDLLTQVKGFTEELSVRHAMVQELIDEAHERSQIPTTPSEDKTQLFTPTVAVDGDDRRRHPRGNRPVPVTLLVGNEQLSGVASDVSAGGLFFPTDTFIELGTLVHLRMEVAMGTLVSADGAVVWARRGDGRRPGGLGVEIVALETGGREILEGLVQTAGIAT